MTRAAEDVLVIRLSSLGDVVHALPAFAAIRRSRPNARISWVVEKSGAEVLRFVEGLDEVIVRDSDGWSGRLRRRDRTAVDFQGLWKSGWIAARSGARVRLGFSGRNLRERGASLFYTERLPEFDETDHVIRKNLRLLSAIGIDGDGPDLAFPLRIPADLVASVRARLAAAAPESRFDAGTRIVVCNVGAAWPTKRWPADAWSRFLEGLRRPRLSPLLLWGSDDEKAAAEEISSKTGVPVAPFLSIADVLALLSASRLLVSGDTFALQAACALSVRTLGLFGPTDPRRNGPFDPRDRVVRADVDCRGCYRRSCAKAPCMGLIAPDDVLRNALELLGSS